MLSGPVCVSVLSVCHNALVDSKFDKSRQQHQQCQLETKIPSPLIYHLAIQVGWSSINRPRQSSWHWKSVIFLTPLSSSFEPLFAVMYSMVLGNPFPISKFTWHQHVSVPETCHISSRFSFVFLKKFETRLPCHWKAKFKVLLAPAFSFMQPGLVVDSKRRV